MDTASYYRELGLRSGASLSQVKASYRRLARQYHPDVNPENEQAKNKFIAITEAYKFLLTVAAPEVVGEAKTPVAKPTNQAVPPELERGPGRGTHSGGANAQGIVAPQGPPGTPAP